MHFIGFICSFADSFLILALRPIINLKRKFAPQTTFRQNRIPMKKYFGALVLALALASCSSDAPVAESPASASNTTWEIEHYAYSTDEVKLAEAINNHRQSIGLAPLETTDYVSVISSEHNQYMIENNVVNHDNFELRAQEIIETMGASTVHENVAYNFSTASSVLAAWLNSDEHKANIEGDFTHFGVSIRIDPETGKKFYTNIFVKL